MAHYVGASCKPSIRSVGQDGPCLGMRSPGQRQASIGLAKLPPVPSGPLMTSRTQTICVGRPKITASNPQSASVQVKVSLKAHPSCDELRTCQDLKRVHPTGD